MAEPTSSGDAEHAERRFPKGEDAGRTRWLDDLYAQRPPWEIGHPQPAFDGLARAGEIRGRVLDIGCGTGEHSLMCADLGLEVTGVDLAASALRTARDKADRRGATGVRFLQHDALRLGELGERFDTVLDSGLFHMLDEDDRPAFTAGLAAVMNPGARYFMLCFSDREPGAGGHGPHRMTREGITAAFGDTLRIDSAERTTLEIIMDPGHVQAWLAAMTRSD